MRTIIACMVIVGSLLGFTGIASASHKTEQDKMTFIKVNDLGYIGAKPSQFEMVGCGNSTNTKCTPGQIPIYTSYWALKRNAANLKGKTILFDQEHWSYTPAREYDNPVYYAEQIAKLCKADNIKLIFTGSRRGTENEIAIYDAAAQYGAREIAIQSQRNDGTLKKFRQYLSTVMGSIREVNSSVPIIAGIATDAGGSPISASQMVKDYNYAYTRVAGFWLNSPEWPEGQGCAPEGCPATARQFLKDIHA